MPGISEIALGAAPILGGTLLGAAAGNIKTTDVRALIKQDLDLLERIPPEQTERRANLQRSIDQRVDEVIASAAKARALREAAASYSGNWRDIVVFVCALLFTIIWWHVDHNRTNWLVFFIVLIALSVVVGFYATRGLSNLMRGIWHTWVGGRDGG